MNTNDPREPASTEGGQFGDDDNVEVLVEDLFIEDYPAPLAPQQQRALRERGRIARTVRKNATPLLTGIAAVGGFVLAMLLLRSHHRKPSRLLRSFLKLER